MIKVESKTQQVVNSQAQSSKVATHEEQGSVEFVERRKSLPEAKLFAKKQKNVGQQSRLPAPKKAVIAPEATIKKQPTQVEVVIEAVDEPTPQPQKFEVKKQSKAVSSGLPT